MKAKQDQKLKETDDWKDKYLRALADYQNLERRVREQSIADRKFATKEVVLNFLPVIDDLVKAQIELKNDGLKLILDKLDGVLKKEGVTRKHCSGEKYDETFMECVTVIDGEKDNVVVSEVRPAYFMNGETIRTAQVIVSKKKSEQFN